MISVCTFSAGTAGNVIPDDAVLQGTARYLRVEMAEEMAACTNTVTTSRVNTRSPSTLITAGTTRFPW